MLAPYTGRSAPRDQPIWLTDGCFDPLHRGHLAFFEALALEAAGAGATVAVAVASDATVLTKRPLLFARADRAALLAPLLPTHWLIWPDGPEVSSIIRTWRPTRYIKGIEWTGHLPPATREACRVVGTQASFMPTVPRDSSTARLLAWAERLHQIQYTHLAQWMRAQSPAGSAWRPPAGHAYDLATRRAVEDGHPDRLLEVFPGLTFLDYGCGPGHVVLLLRERGAEAHGYDPAWEALGEWAAPGMSAYCGADPPAGADVVICREVFEHVPLREWMGLCGRLTALARRFIYLTVRLNQHARSWCEMAGRDALDPDHRTLAPAELLRLIWTLWGWQAQPAVEERLDWQQQGRVFVYASPTA